jgi:hypothetical protein
MVGVGEIFIQGYNNNKCYIGDIGTLPTILRKFTAYEKGLE